MSRKVNISKPVTWLSDEIHPEQKICNSFRFYTKFQFKKIVGEIGDFVLISNTDAAEPDTEGGCDAARILTLYEDPSNSSDPCRAKVQWFSRPQQIPKSCLNTTNSIEFLEREVLEDHRPFDTDVSIETFFKKCSITITSTKDTEFHLNQPYNYICRYRLMPISKRKVQIEPVLEQERKALELLCTPTTPNRLTKRLSELSVSERKSWSVSKNNGTKLLLRRALLTDEIEKSSPRKVTPTASSSGTIPKTQNNVNKKHKEEILSMELKENSDEDELPTLIIRQHMPTTPKRKSSMARANKETPTPKEGLFVKDKEETYSTRSGRIIRNSRYFEPESSPVKTPIKTKYNMSESDDDFTPQLKTPKTPRHTATPKGIGALRTPKTPRTSGTPKSAARRIKTSELTPSLHPRAHPIENVDQFLKDVESLPGREKHIEEIVSFVRNKLLTETSGCMYISGVPGTGKTATVCAALKILKEDMDLPEFHSVEVNGMKMAEPRQAYVQIYKQLTGQTLASEQACNLLGKRFTKPAPRRVPTVLIVDELDALCTRRQDVLYNIVEWASHDSALLTVLAIANTMDLPERAMKARVASRVGLTRLTFQPYTHTQLQTIVEAGLTNARLTPDALQLIGRKVAAVSGDARRALALCARAIELAGEEATTVHHVERALDEATTSVMALFIQDCSPAEKLILRAVAAEVERTGCDETTLSRALGTAGALMALEGRPYKSATSIRPPTYEQTVNICWGLYAKRLLFVEDKPGDPRLSLNVSVDDVHYATRQFST